MCLRNGEEVSETRTGAGKMMAGGGIRGVPRAHLWVHGLGGMTHCRGGRGVCMTPQTSLTELQLEKRTHQQRPSCNIHTHTNEIWDTVLTRLDWEVRKSYDRIQVLSCTCHTYFVLGKWHKLSESQPFHLKILWSYLPHFAVRTKQNRVCNAIKSVWHIVGVH